MKLNNKTIGNKRMRMLQDDFFNKVTLCLSECELLEHIIYTRSYNMPIDLVTKSYEDRINKNADLVKRTIDISTLSKDFNGEIHLYCKKENVDFLESYNRLLTNILKYMINFIESLSDTNDYSENSLDHLTRITHDLRSPLGIIKGFSNLLSETTITSTQKEYLRHIKSSTLSLQNLVDTILEYNTIDHSVISNTSVDIDGLIEDIALKNNIVANQKGLKIIVNQPDEELPFIYIDPVRLEQVIQNLITNAIKYTEEGQIQIDYSLEFIGVEKPKLVISISDTGIGIEESHLQNLFQPFYMVNKNGSNSSYGLGLSIVAKLLELMDSDITVTSKLGAGTTFTINFNIEIKEPTFAEPSTSFKEKYENILILEIDKVFSSIITSLLSDVNHHVNIDNNMSDFKNNIMNNKHDIIIADPMIKNLLGVDIIDIIKSEDSMCQNAKVIAITALLDKTKILNEGYDFYIDKASYNLKEDLINAINGRIIYSYN